jgi:1,4-dihydroxy-2-naphthoate octaprenyltransferase
MSALSVAIGTGVAAASGPVHWGWFVLVLAGIVLVHAATNVINDYFDARYDVDQPDSPTAKYRAQPILAEVLTPRELAFEAIVLFTVACGIGLVLTVCRSHWVFWICLAGFFASVFYTAGPVKYKYSALGELSVFLMWGPLMMEGAFVVQRQTLSWDVVHVSVPFGIWVALVLLANNMRDIDYDTRVHITTLSIILGRRRSLILFNVLLTVAYGYVAATILMGLVDLWGLLVFLSLPNAVALVREFATGMPDAADALTAKVLTVFGALLLLAVILTRLVPL